MTPEVDDDGHRGTGCLGDVVPCRGEVDAAEAVNGQDGDRDRDPQREGKRREVRTFAERVEGQDDEQGGEDEVQSPEVPEHACRVLR